MAVLSRGHHLMVPRSEVDETGSENSGRRTAACAIDSKNWAGVRCLRVQCDLIS